MEGFNAVILVSWANLEGVDSFPAPGQPEDSSPPPAEVGLPTG